MQSIPVQQSAGILREQAGTLANGTPVEAVTLAIAGGISARILTYGATLQSLIAPDAQGTLADVVMGHDDVCGYEANRAFLGVTVGRYANRMAGGYPAFLLKPHRDPNA